MELSDLEDFFQQAASIENALQNKDRKRLDAKCHWPDYLYDLDDKKDQEVEPIKLAITSRQISILDQASIWLNLLGIRRNKRIITGKRIIWARASGFSYSEIASIAGISPSTCKNWYKQDMTRLLLRLNTYVKL